jgi:transposase
MEIEDHDPQTKPRVSLEVRWEIVHQKRIGTTGSEVSQSLDIPVSTCNAIYRKWQETGTVEDIKQGGRPPKVTEEEEKMLVETAKTHPDMSLTQLMGEIDAPFSKATSWRLLKDNGFNNRTLPEKWAVSDYHRQLRLEWAKEYVHKPDEYWQNVIFTDESMIQNNPHKQTYWVSEDTILPSVERDRWQASVLCWGAISYQGNCILECMDGTMNGRVYLDILKRRLLKNYPALSPQTKRGAGMKRLIYQHDGSKVHGEKNVTSYFTSKEIEVIKWPAKSPDLNLIEAVWSQLKYKLKRSYQNKEELVEDICNCWESIPFSLIENLYKSMNRRIQAVIAAEGGPTDY